MAENLAISAAERDFITPYLLGGKYDDTTALGNKRPFVTLTYAQSMDGMISLGAGLRTVLSGPETKAMTHFLRNNHEAILVGSGTAVVDNPSLNSRYNEPGVATKHPTPIIIDPNRRWSYEGSKIAQLYRDGKGQKPLIIRRHHENPQQPAFDGDDNAADSNKASTSTEAIDWEAILYKIGRQGIKSVMIEGGAGVINALLARPHLIDSVIVTIAPTWLGTGGVLATPPPKTIDGVRTNAVDLDRISWRSFGRDAVMCGKLRR